MFRRSLPFMLVGMMIFGLCVPSSSQAKTLLEEVFPNEDISVEVSASLDFYDKYVWRGFVLDKDSVLQPGVTIAAAGFEGGFWGSWDLESEDGLSSDEVDGWIGYGFDLGFMDESLEIVGMSFGNTWYDFPEASLYSKEFYLGFSLDVPLSPSFTWYHDYGEEENGGADGNYFIFSIGYSLDVSEEYGITLDLGQEVGFNNEAFIAGEGGHSLTTIGFTIPLSEKVNLAPSLGYSLPFGDLEDANDGNQDDEFFGGFSLSFGF